MLPRVIVHNAVSVDGRIDWFAPDIGLFYELASRWQEDAILAGSETIVKGLSAEGVPVEEDVGASPPSPDPADKRPLLVIPDSRGRVRNWHYLRAQPYWRDAMALCSRATPAEYLAYLRERRVDYIVAGEDLRAALANLYETRGVRAVRVDSGGTLNGVLLRAGLVDEVSVLISPRPRRRHDAALVLPCARPDVGRGGHPPEAHARRAPGRRHRLAALRGSQVAPGAQLRASAGSWPSWQTDFYAVVAGLRSLSQKWEVVLQNGGS